MQSKELARVLRHYKDKPVQFNAKLLRRATYWSKQEEICRSFRDNRVTCVTTGNGIGKSYVASGLLLWALMCSPGSKVLSTAPSNQLLADVLWGEVRQAWSRSVFADLMPAVQVKANPQRLVLCDGWDAVGWSSDSTAKMSGRHRKDLVWVIDEGSDILPEVWEGIWSTNPSRVLVLGNPLRTGTDFHRLCTGSNSQVNVIQVSCLDTPDIHLPRSKRGMADATWLQGIREQYGEDSPYWNVHVLGQFNDEDEHTLIPAEWLHRCDTPHTPHGDRWLSVDLSGGTGRGDLAVILVRDRNGVLAMDASRSWPYPMGVAEKVRHYKNTYGVPEANVVYDAGGLGLGFHDALKQVGIKAPKAYIGGATCQSGRATRFRGASALLLRDRLDPSKHAQPFSIRQDWLELLRPEVTGLRYTLASNDKIDLEPKARLKARLGWSPDRLDALLMSFGFDMTPPPKPQEKLTGVSAAFG